MPAVHTETELIKHRTVHARPRAASSKRRVRKILAAVDGSERTNRIVDYLLALAENDEPVEIIVLNTQPEPDVWRLRGYGSFKRQEIYDRLVNDLGNPVVASVGRKLDQVGIAHKDRVEVGDVVETIIRCAGEQDCDVIVISEPRAGLVRQWLARTAGLVFGSIAGRLVQLTETPVLVMK
jgi:nucleotide-binding universal stress UspA family protein